MPEKQKDFSNQSLLETIYIDGKVATAPQIEIGHKPFYLQKYDFDKLINGRTYISDIKEVLIGTTLGLFINMLARFIGSRIDDDIIFDKWELYAFSLSFFLWIVFLVINYFYKTERKRIIRDIKSHFNIEQ